MSIKQLSPGLRFLVIGILVFLLQIPSLFILGLIEDREQTRDQAATEIASKWGLKQEISGPFIEVPVVLENTNEKGQRYEFTNYVYILPDSFHVDGKLLPQLKKRGIYETVLYRSDLTISASFLLPDIGKFYPESKAIKWKESSLFMGISDLKGLQAGVLFKINGKEVEPHPGINRGTAPISEGVTVPIETAMNASVNIDLTIPLNGSEYIRFVPVGKQNKIHLEAPWSDPRFDGNFLPVSSSVTESGFSADWFVSYLNRNFPQVLTSNEYNLSESAFGVDLIVPVDHYLKTSRTVKYSILFIAVTFLAFFMTELFSKILIHPVQYLMTGLGLVIFYTLVLSISEHSGFTFAYWLSAFATIGLITLYSKAIFGGWKVAGVLGLILSFLYLFLYIILQLQDFALLMGSSFLFVLLSVMMYLTRKFDWYGGGTKPESVNAE